MKFLVVILFAVTNAVHAQSILLDACRALPDAERRAACFEELAKAASPATPVPINKHERVIRAAAAISSSIDVGVSLIRYQALIQEFATEVNLANQASASEAESGAWQLFGQAIDAHRDAAIFWDAWIRFYARRDNLTSYFRGIPVDLTGLAWVVNRYNVPTVNADLLGFSRGVDRTTALNAMWKIARDRVADAQIALKTP